MAKPDWTALVALSEADRQRALEQFYWLRPVLEEGVPLLRSGARWRSTRAHSPALAKRYQRAGLAGLAHRARADRGQRRRLAADLRQLIEGLALRKPAPTVASVHRQVCGVAEARGWPRPSYATVYSVVKALDPGLVTLALE
jgi:putative transposase